MRNVLLLTAALGLAVAGCSGTQHMPAGTVHADGSVAAKAFDAPVACKPGVKEIPRAGWGFHTMMPC